MLSKKGHQQIGFILLIFFCAVRPIALIDVNIQLAGFNIPELFAIGLTYLLMIVLALNIRRIEFDLVSIIIIMFCLYCIISIFWGSKIRTIARVVLPFVLFLVTRIAVSKPKKINLLIATTIIAFCFPVIGSFFILVKGSSVLIVDEMTGIERYGGVFKSIRMFSYAMFFFSVFFYYQFFIIKLSNKNVKRALILVALFSFFCLFKSYARTAYLGFIAFWAISIWGFRKKYFFILFGAALIVAVFYTTALEKIFLKKKEVDIDYVSSGRTLLWAHNIDLFLRTSFDRQILGQGLGVGSAHVFGTKDEIWSSHNDYIHLLLQAGFVGLFLYLLIHFLLLKDIYLSKIDRAKKFFYFALLISIMIMNFLSGAIVYNTGCSQLFWMVMSFLYISNQIDVPVVDSRPLERRSLADSKSAI